MDTATEVKHDTIKTYRYVCDYAVIVFTVPGLAAWSEEEWDSAAESDLASYVTTPEQYWLDDTWDGEDINA